MGEKRTRDKEKRTVESGMGRGGALARDGGLYLYICAARHFLFFTGC